MNTLALGSAGIGIAGVLASLYFGGMIKSDRLRLSAQIGGIVVSFLAMVLIPQDEQTVRKAGEYFGMFGVPALIVGVFVMRRKKRTPRSDSST